MLVYVFLLFIGAFLILSLFICITCVSCLGLSTSLHTFLGKFLKPQADRVYDSECGPINSECFICLQRIKDEVVTTCNHSFCGHCFVSYLQSRPNQSVACPACRKDICILFRRFTANNAQNRQIKRKIAEYNHSYSKQPSFLRAIWEFGNVLKNMPIMLSLEGLRYLMTNTRVRSILLMAVYTLSPIDLLPEIVLGPLGLIDDFAVALNIVRQASGLIQDFMREENQRNQ